MKPVVKRLLSTALILAGLGTATLALAGWRHGPCLHGRPDPARMQRLVTNHLEDLLDDVKATDAQRQRVHALRDRLLADAQALHADHDAAHQELLAQWRSDQPDRAAVRALVDGKADRMKAFADEVTDAVLELHDLLTPEQRAVVAKKLERHLAE